jgi:hypothetical protein
MAVAKMVSRMVCFMVTLVVDGLIVEQKKIDAISKNP